MKKEKLFLMIERARSIYDKTHFAKKLSLHIEMLHSMADEEWTSSPPKIQNMPKHLPTLWNIQTKMELRLVSSDELVDC